MRTRIVLSALIALTAVTASVTVRRLARNRRTAPVRTAPVRTTPAGTTPAGAAPARAVVPAAPVPPASAVGEGVVVPFTRPAAPAAAAAPAAKCGDHGGVTRAGAPCAARGTVGGRCHHHRVAA